MRKFLCRLSIFAVYILIVQVIMPIAIDPANVFHAEHIRQLPTEPNKNYIKMKYILAHPDKFDGYMFGSSRIGSIHTENIAGTKVYNMTYSAGLPVEHLANIRTMLNNNIKPSIIYMGVDEFSYTEKAESHLSQQFRCPYEYLYDNPKRFYSLYLNPYYTLRALFAILRAGEPAHKGADPEIFYSYGWWADYENKAQYNWSKSRYIYIQNNKLFDSKRIAETLNSIQDICNVCRDNNIRLVLFTNPMYCLHHLNAIDRDYTDFLRGLAEISDFWNFSGINDITLNRKNFIDDRHYSAYIGDMLLNVMCSGEVYPELNTQGFGVKVTSENVEQIINLLKTQADSFRKTL